MEKRKNDKGQSQHTEGSVYQENWWLDEEDSEELPVFNLDEAEDYAKHRQRLTGEPVVTGYEALERRRGVRRPTYDTPGASHVGIYVGNNMMIHCGNPIQYTSIASSYWQQHFMAFGRIH